MEKRDSAERIAYSSLRSSRACRHGSSREESGTSLRWAAASS
jgi:hypothetical protein